jgi:hypothetical protein
MKFYWILNSLHSPQIVGFPCIRIDGDNLKSTLRVTKNHHYLFTFIEFALIRLRHNETLKGSPPLKTMTFRKPYKYILSNSVSDETCTHSVLYWANWWSGKFMCVPKESRLELWVKYWVLLKHMDSWVLMSFEGLICMYFRDSDSSNLNWGHRQTLTELVTVCMWHTAASA